MFGICDLLKCETGSFVVEKFTRNVSLESLAPQTDHVGFSAGLSAGLSAWR